MNNLIIKTDVIIVKLYNDLILSGTGNFLHIYSRKDFKLLNKVKIFNGQKIHGIFCKFEPLIVFGGKELCIISINRSNCEIIVDIKLKLTYDDWILDSILCKVDSEILTVSSHNVVTAKNLSTSYQVWQTECQENSILYGAQIVQLEESNSLYVLAGTVFSEILIWSPRVSNGILFRLVGHEGVIFSISWYGKENLICSTSDDRSVRLWNVDLTKISSLKITKPRLTLYGHTARVWRAQILDKYIISIGEDSIINIWYHNGKLVRKIEAHQPDCIWSLDCDEGANQIVTGGGDSGLFLHAIEENICGKSIPFTLSDSKNVYKKLKFIDSDNFVVVTEYGCLLHYNTEKGMEQIEQHSNLKNISLTVLLCQKKVALAGFSNKIYIYKLDNDKLINDSIIEIFTDKVFSLHWLNEKTIIFCDCNGHLATVDLSNNNKVEHFNILPKNKERWPTAVCELKDCTFLGDRNGSIHVYRSKKLVQSLTKVHGYLGITSLQIFKAKYLISTGRDGTIKKIQIFHNSTKLINQSTIIKIPFKWIADTFLIENNNNLVVGFQENNFIVYNISQTRKVFEHDCGGGHRSWDIYTSDNHHYIFLYIKDKSVHSVCFSTDNFQEIEQSFHSYEINKVIPLFQTEKNIFFLSGGEDTTIKFNQFSSHKSCFKTLASFRNHLSSVRCMNFLPISDENSREFLVFSGGGRAQLVISKLIYCEKTEELDFFSLLSRTVTENCDSETRIMDIGVHSFDTNIYLFLACSDGYLRVYFFDFKNNKLNIIYCNNYHNSCLHRLSLLNSDRAQINLLLMTNNGYLSFWNFSKILKNNQKDQLKNCRDSIQHDKDIIDQSNIGQKEFSHKDHKNCVEKTNMLIGHQTNDQCNVSHKESQKDVMYNSFSQKDLIDCLNINENCIDNKLINHIDNSQIAQSKGQIKSQKELSSKPFYSLRDHQSGVNSFCFKQYTKSKFLLATGGDDCWISCNLIDIDFRSEQLEILSKWQSGQLHCSQITGLLMSANNLLISCSTDQRITLIKVDICEDDVLNCICLSQYCSTVPDLLGVFDLSVKNETIVGVYGKGVEIVKCSEVEKETG